MSHAQVQIYFVPINLCSDRGFERQTDRQTDQSKSHKPTDYKLTTKMHAKGKARTHKH